MLMQHISRPIAKDELKRGRTACHQQWNAERLHVAHCLGMSCQGEIEAAQPVPTQGVSTCSATLPVISHTFYPSAPLGDETTDSMPFRLECTIWIQSVDSCNVMHDADTASAGVALAPSRAAIG